MANASNAPQSCANSVDAPALGLSVASTTAPPDLQTSCTRSLARDSLEISMVASENVPPCGDADSFDALAAAKLNVQYSSLRTENSTLAGFPRTVTPMQLLEESDGESTWCGPPSETEENSTSTIRALEAWGINRVHGKRRHEHGQNTAVIDAAAAAAGLSSFRVGNSDALQDCPLAEIRNKRRSGHRAKRQLGQAQTHRAPPLIQPLGNVNGINQKFVCVFTIGLEDDEEFCLVKRILGKAGNNMRRIAEECSAKVRLRGIGSGFLEGADGREANMPLQLNVSCSDFGSYQGAVDRVSTLLKELYKHYGRYARSKGIEAPDFKVIVDEVRRDDWCLDILQQKAQRSPSQRERDRKACERERQELRQKGRERKSLRNHDAESVFSQTPATLPGCAPIPTTPAGRRLAAKAGGAEHAAIVSAAAREQEKLEHDRTRKEMREKEKGEREMKQKEAAERAAAFASRARRSTTRTSPSAKNSWEEWDLWASAAGKGRHCDKGVSNSGSRFDAGTFEGKETGRSKPQLTPVITEASNRCLAVVGKSRR